MTLANKTQEEVYDAFLSHAWKEMPFGSNPELSEECFSAKDGLNCLRTISPVSAKEKIIKTDYPHSLTYKLLNPGYTNFAAEEDSHEGNVKFIKTEGGVTMTWHVKWQPLRYFEVVTICVVTNIIPLFQWSFNRKLDSLATEKTEL